MAMSNFKSPPLPSPPRDYDPHYITQLIRILEIYHRQLDSNTPNYAQTYTADNFYGIFNAKQVTTAEKTALTVDEGAVVYDTTLNKLCVYTGAAWETVTSV